MTKPKYIEGKIKRLTRELNEIDQYSYPGADSDERTNYVSMLERKRDDRVRSVVLQLHTSIEDLLNLYLISNVLRISDPTKRSRKLSTTRGKALHKMLYGGGSLGFEMKLNFALALGLISARAQAKLMELNTIRNKCSHNWLLKVPQRRKRRPGQKKPPLLLYEGRDLHGVQVLKDFIAEFSRFYVLFWLKYRRPRT
jgi:hypothetical protein